MANNTPQLGMIISIFRDLALRHKMINDFIVGERFDIGASNPLKFPYLWLSYDQSVISGAINSNAQTITYVMQVAVMDKIKKGDSNYDNILSDTHYILSTIISEMVQHQYYANLNIKLDGDIIFNAAQEFSDDNSNGWIATFRLKVPMRYTYCNSPIEPITGYQTSYQDGISTYRLQGAQGPQGLIGFRGFQGFDGVQGTQGSTGSTGPQGPQGFQGDTGSNGVTGFQGNQGIQGPQGFQGFQGFQGLIGSTGFQGNIGSTGSSVQDEYYGLHLSAGSKIICQTFGFAQSDNTAITPVSGRIIFGAIYIPINCTIEGVVTYLRQQGVFTGGNNNEIGLYSYSGGTMTRIAITSNDQNIWKSPSQAYNLTAFTSPVSVSAGIHFVGLVWTSSSTTNTPIHNGLTIQNSGFNGQFVGGAFRYYTTLNSSTLATSYSMASLGNATACPWFALYTT